MTPNTQNTFTIPTWVGPMLGALVGVVLGFFLKPLEERWLSAKLKIDFEKAPGNKDETDDSLYIRFRVSQNRKAMSCICDCVI
jgi:hypothetical protein